MVNHPPRSKTRTVGIVLIAVAAGLATIGSLLYWQRYNLAVRILQGSDDTRDMVIQQIQERAAPVIKAGITMNLLQKLFSALGGRRSEEERQADALEDVRQFNEASFENHSLSFDVAHNRDSYHGFKLDRSDFVLVWNRGTTPEVLAEFDVDFLTRSMTRLRINEACSYFADLTSYIEEKAREN